MHIYIDFPDVLYYLTTFSLAAAAVYVVLRSLVLRLKCRAAVDAQMQENYVYCYSYNGQTYFGRNRRYDGNMSLRAGSTRQIFVNPKHPDQFLDVPAERSYTWKSALFLLICAVPILFLSAFSFQETARRAEQATRQRYEQTASSLSAAKKTRQPLAVK